MVIPASFYTDLERNSKCSIRAKLTTDRKQKNQKQQALSPKSTDGSTQTNLQPSWSLRRILVTAILPPLLEPPVSRTWPGLTKAEAIPSPSIETGMVRKLRAVALQDGQTDDTGYTSANTHQKITQTSQPSQQKAVQTCE